MKIKAPALKTSTGCRVAAVCLSAHGEVYSAALSVDASGFDLGGRCSLKRNAGSRQAGESLEQVIRVEGLFGYHAPLDV